MDIAYQLGAMEVEKLQDIIFKCALGLAALAIIAKQFFRKRSSQVITRARLQSGSPGVGSGGGEVFISDFAGFSTPRISAQLPEVEITRCSYEEGIQGTVCLRGSIEFANISDLEAERDSISPGYIHLNGELLAGHPVPISVTDAEHSFHFGYECSFESKLVPVDLTEGINTLEVFFQDPVTKLESSFFCGFTLSSDEEGDFSVIEVGDVKIHSCDTGAEFRGRSISFDTSSIDLEEGTKLILTAGDRGSLSLKRGPDAGENEIEVFDSSSEKPLQFMVMPSRKPLNFAAIEYLVGNRLNFPPTDSVAEEMLFQEFFLIGLFSNGGDLVSEGGEVFRDTIKVLPKTNPLEIRGEVVSPNGKESSIRIELVLNEFGFDSLSSNKQSFAAAMWELAKIYRQGRDGEVDVQLALLTEEFESLGTERVFSNWEKWLLCNCSKALDEVNKIGAKTSVQEHGFYVGMMFAIFWPIAVPPLEGGEWERPLMSALLEHFVDSIRKLPL